MFVNDLFEKKKPEPEKTRNFVAKNAKMGGAGAHKDKKKADKQGDVKHKKDPAADLVESNRDYELGFASPSAPALGNKAGFKRQELQHELGHEQNNIAIAINGRTWKVVPGKGRADSKEEWSYLNNMKSWADKKSASSGKKWTVHLTGAPATNEARMGTQNKENRFRAIHQRDQQQDRLTRQAMNNIKSEASLGTVLKWPEVVNKVNSAMKAMGWKGQRKDDNSYMFSTQGQEADDQFYIAVIENKGNGMFYYALGTFEGGRPDIGEEDSLPTTEASVSELMNSIRDGFGLNEESSNSYGYEVGQTVKLHNGTQGRVLDIFDDSIEVLLPGGRTVTVAFQDANVLDEGGKLPGKEFRPVPDYKPMLDRMMGSQGKVPTTPRPPVPPYVAPTAPAELKAGDIIGYRMPGTKMVPTKVKVLKLLSGDRAMVVTSSKRMIDQNNGNSVITIGPLKDLEIQNPYKELSTKPVARPNSNAVMKEAAEDWLVPYNILLKNNGEPSRADPTIASLNWKKSMALAAKEINLSGQPLFDFIKDHANGGVNASYSSEIDQAQRKLYNEILSLVQQAPTMDEMRAAVKQQAAGVHQQNLTNIQQQLDLENAPLQHELSVQALINKAELDRADQKELLDLDMEARLAIIKMKQELELDAKERLVSIEREIKDREEREDVRKHELAMAQAGYKHEIDVISTTAEGEYKKAKLEADYQIQIKQLDNIDNAGERQNRLDQINTEKAKQLAIIDSETKARISIMQKEVDVEQQSSDIKIEQAFMMTLNPIWGAAITAAHVAGATWDAGINNIKKALAMLAKPIMPTAQKVGRSGQKTVAETKSLHKRVKIVRGPDAGKYGWIREIKHGAFKGAEKRYYVDIEGGGQANNLSVNDLRIAKDQSVAEATGDEKFDKPMRQMTGKITPDDAAEMWPTQEFEPINLDPSYMPSMEKYKAKLFPLAYQYWTDGDNADELRKLGWEPDYGDDYVMVVLSGIGHDGHIQYDKYDFDAEGEDIDEGVAESMPMADAVKALRHYGAGHFKTTSNELHFYKQGRPFSVDLIWGDEGERSVNLSQLNSATRRLKGQGVAEVAPPGAKAERMVKHIKKGYARDGKLSDKERSIAFATAWKAHNKEINEEIEIRLIELRMNGYEL